MVVVMVVLPGLEVVAVLVLLLFVTNLIPYRQQVEEYQLMVPVVVNIMFIHSIISHIL